MVKRSIINAALMSFLLTCNVACCAASGPPKELQPAIKAYNSKDYHGAVALMSKLTGAAANNEYTHYYRAMAYQGLHRYADAKTEYMWNYEHGKDAGLKYQAWQGLQGLAKLPAGNGGSAAASASAGAGALPATASELSGDAAKAAAELHINPSGNAPVATKPTNAFKFEYEWKAGCPRHQ